MDSEVPNEVTTIDADGNCTIWLTVAVLTPAGMLLEDNEKFWNVFPPPPSLVPPTVPITI